MAIITIQDKINKAKLKRSQSIMSKINILWTRDGHENPDIEGQKDVDNFNGTMLFGASGNENIDWNNMGVEGLIRCYYHISYLIKGTRRDNIIRNYGTAPVPSYCACTNAHIENTARLELQGAQASSGFFVDNDTEARKGTFDLNSSAFTTNRINDEYDEGLFKNQIQQLIDTIGLKSNLGYKAFYNSRPALEEIINRGQMLGERNTDVYFYFHLNPGKWQRYAHTNLTSTTLPPTSPYDPSSTQDHQADTFTVYKDNVLLYSGDDPEDYHYSVSSSSLQITLNTLPAPDETITILVFRQTNGEQPEYYEYGNNHYDNGGYTILCSDDNFTTNPNKWASDWTLIINRVKSRLQEIIAYINYTKIQNFSYFVNPNIIPGKTQNYSLQDGWLNTCNTAINNIDAFWTIFNQYYIDQNNTAPAGKVAIDDALATLKTQMQTAQTQVNAIYNTINANSFFGNTSDNGATLWGARAQWIKTILDVNEGSRIVISGISTVIAQMNLGVTKAEEEFKMFGVERQSVPWATSNAWIGGLSTPEILAIEFHQIIDLDQNSETFAELIADGFIVSWQSTAHATGYDIYKSLDWNGTTGTWTKILAAGNQFTVQTINPGNGQIYNYYTDTSTDPNTGIKPYYKIQAFDSGGSGDYSRIPANSLFSEPKNIDAFEGNGSTGGNNGTYSTGGGTSIPDNSNDGGITTNPTVGAVYWREPALTFLTLPLNGNRDGDVRLVISEGSLYRWFDTDKEWLPISSQGNSSWKDPVETLSFLPVSGNTDGDIRLVNNEGKLYRWDSESEVWIMLQGGSSYDSLNHNDLSDMPDTDGNNADHDERYYTEEEIDNKVTTLTSQLDALKFLIPENALPLNGTLKLSNREYQIAYLSHGYSQNQRFDTLNPEQQYNQVIKNGRVILTSQLDLQFNNADKGSLDLYVNDSKVDTFNLENAFDEAYRSNSQIYPPAYGNDGYIKITEVKMYNNYALYQKGKFEIILDDTILVAGENSIRLEHVFGTTTHTTNTLIIFFDPSNDIIAINTFNISQERLVSNKYMSGLRYYGINDALNISMRIEKLFNNTYIEPNQVYVDSSTLAITPYWINHKSPGSSFVDYGQPWQNAILVSNEEKTLTIDSIVCSKPILKAKGFNLLEGNEYTFEKNILINTCSNLSTDKIEYFSDEKYRLPYGPYDSIPNDFKNQWNSTQPINSNDLQVFAGNLVYPRNNFMINYLPEQTVNYNGLLGTRYYIRSFYDQGVPHNNGIIHINGYNKNEHPYINVYLKLPGQTDWMPLTELYNEADFNGYATNGCLLNHDEYFYQFTTGKFSTADSGYLLLIKISMTENNYVPIEELNINW